MSEDEIRTRVALADWKEHRFFGHAVFAELVGNTSLTALYSLAVTGRMPQKETVRVLDEMAATLTVADPRIWPLKVSRIAACLGQPILGWCFGALSQDRALIGADVPREAAKWLQRYAAARAAGESRESLLRTVIGDRNYLVGFGVPVRSIDERVECLKKRLRILRRDDLPHWCSFMEVAEAIRDRPRMVPNIAGACAAILLDCGYSPLEVGNLVPVLPQHTFVANAVEASTQRSHLLLRLPLKDVSYEGPSARKSPLRLRHEKGFKD